MWTLYASKYNETDQFSDCVHFFFFQDDPELAAIRQRRMQEMMAKSGGGAGAGGVWLNLNRMVFEAYS